LVPIAEETQAADAAPPASPLPRRPAPPPPSSPQPLSFSPERLSPPQPSLLTFPLLLFGFASVTATGGAAAPRCPARHTTVTFAAAAAATGAAAAAIVHIKVIHCLMETG